MLETIECNYLAAGKEIKKRLVNELTAHGFSEGEEELTLINNRFIIIINLLYLLLFLLLLDYYYYYY